MSTTVKCSMVGCDVNVGLNNYTKKPYQYCVSCATAVKEENNGIKVNIVIIIT